MKDWEKDVLQGKVLPNLYRARGISSEISMTEHMKRLRRQ